MVDSSTSPLLSTFQRHVEDMRNLVLCKICMRPLYEPYILACGHTFCYGCLTSWFGGSGPTKKKIKKCPDCRAVVNIQPAPNYLLRDLTHMFVSRAELLPEDEETTQQHEIARLEETAQMNKDRDARGLFHGAFKPPVHMRGAYRAPIQDLHDGVSRCPHCLWEMEDGECNACGYSNLEIDEMSGDDGIFDESESLGSDSELDHDVDAVDADFGITGPNQFYGISDGDDESTSENSYSGDEAMSAAHGLQGHTEDERSDYTRESTPAGPVFGGYVSSNDEHDNEDEDMEGFVVNDDEVEIESSSGLSSPVAQPIQRRRHYIVDSDESESEKSPSSGTESEKESDDTATQSKTNDETESDDSNSEESSDDNPASQTLPRRRRRRLVIDDDEEEQSGEEEKREHDGIGGFDGGQSYSGADHDWTEHFRNHLQGPPPQSRTNRTNHLNNQRAARRGGNSSTLNGHFHPYSNSRWSPSAEISASRSNARGSMQARQSRPFTHRPGFAA